VARTWPTAWDPEAPIRLSRSDIARRYGRPFSDNAVERAVQLGMLVPAGSSFVVPSPSLFEAGAELVAAGVPLDVVLDLAASVQDDLARVAFRFVDVTLTHVVDRPVEEISGPLSEDEIHRLLRLRPYAQKTVDALLLMAMQRESDRLLDKFSAVTVSGATDSAPR
jgi:hypothetical protein